MATKVAELSPKAKEILEFMKEAKRPMTLAEIKEHVADVNPAHLTALRKRAELDATEVEKEVVTTVKRKVLEYALPADTDTE